MLEFWQSLLRQSKPSTLTAAGLSPNFILVQPPLREDDDGDETLEGDGIDNGEIAVNFSSPNRASWIKGLEDLLGGDPQKYGGDEANWVVDSSPP
jgi:hypothetical protein